MYLSYQSTPAEISKRVLGFKPSLAQQFLIVATGVLLLGMFAMGAWVTRRIEKGVADVAAASAALYINNFIAPHLQELATGDVLSDNSIRNLNEAMKRPSVRTHVTSIKIWKQDGLIVYSSEKDLIGRSFPQNPNPRKAWSGEVTAEFDDLYHEEDARERAKGIPLLEVFTPIRDAHSGEVIAVLEFHERAEVLKAHLDEDRWRSWMITALITLAMIGALFVIVADGSKTIDQQRAALAERVSQLSRLLQQNQALRARIERAARSATEDNERLMRRLGYDLHDGIAQLISLALVRLDRVQHTEQSSDNIGKIQKALSDALTDIRNLCRGLLLPEIQDLTLADALMLMVRHHERRTGTAVSCNISGLPAEAPQFVKISLCRFVQEGLNNAFKHAGGEGQQVCASWDGETITIEVADEGPGMSVPDDPGDEIHLGLRGLRDRIESIGGVMNVRSTLGAGTCVAACITLIARGSNDG
ncbi:sensor histidine kinase [Microvirga aerophila]|uniref:histidine kinase n=1 Tax=Microvirga aerophila TaxID=670291 RepID=A0A512C288_9HYPH|nr:ATP-binding protein [Microvirga aerophila]GEO18137.1 histidine kinase [Microvirga aerophila]